MQRTWKKTQKIKMRSNPAKLNYLVIILVYTFQLCTDTNTGQNKSNADTEYT